MRGQAGMRDPKHELERLVTLIVEERRRRTLAALRALWRIGDGVRRFKRVIGRGDWSRTIERCAARVGMHAASLEEAAHAADVFRPAERRALRERFERAGAELTPSHVLELARAPPRERARGVEALLRKRHSIRELRSYLRRGVL